MSAQPYRPGMPADWWLVRPSYVRYMLRELTCVFVGAYTGVWIAGLYALARGHAQWFAFLEALESGVGIVFQLVCLAFVLYHTVTWFALAPRTMPPTVTAQPGRARAITGAHYVVWAVITIGILWLGGA